MSGVKNWLMEMQEYSWHLIDEMADRNISLEQAQETFVAKYGQAQVTVLNDLIADNNDEWAIAFIITFTLLSALWVWI